MRPTPLAVLSVLLAAAIQSGCVYIHTKIPDDWAKAMSRPAASVAGTFRTGGEQAIKDGGDRIAPANLVGVINAVMADQSYCPPADSLRLRPVGQTQLELTALNDGETTATKTLTADIGAETSLDGVKVARENNRKNSKIRDLTTHEDAVLMIGSDGFLYVHVKHRATATVGGVIPFGGGGETWLRFPPTP